MEEKITLCGDNCMECPRYNAHSEEELSSVAELWCRVGWRDHVVSNEEIQCTGCSSHKQCTYHLVECTKEHKVEKCNQCVEFPCEKIKDMLERSKAYQKRCKEVCSDKEYDKLEKAFFNKENNLGKKNDEVIPMEKVEIVYNQVEEAISVMREVARWGREQGFRVWLDEWLTPEELVTEEATPETFCIGKVNGEVACAFILQKSDREYWGDTAEKEAVYLHKICVRREFAHRDMTKSVVNAIRKACKRTGVKYIRLDTGLDEKVVRKIYLKAGFKIVDILDFENGKSLALYEMEV